VLGEFRDRGIGAGLLAAAVGYADQHGFARLVLRPAKRAVPFYQRAGFTLENDLMLRED
jgi:GNAT superfamily N-acetyltransferase